MDDGLDLLELLLPVLLNLNEFFLHRYFELVFYLVEGSLQFKNLLLNLVLPAELIYVQFLPVVLNHWQYFFLQFFHFAHHFLFSLVVNFPLLAY